LPSPDLGKIGRNSFRGIVTRTRGEFTFAGNTLANPKAKDHIAVELYESAPHMEKAFEYAGQGKIKQGTIKAIARKRWQIYFPVTGWQCSSPAMPDSLKRLDGFRSEVGRVCAGGDG
jgi:hypothetical protein